MKVLRKVNKGLILTIIVLIILSIYLIGVEANRNKEKADIEKICKEYVELTNKYAVMPEENQKIYNNSQITAGEAEKKKEDLKKEINTQMNKFAEELKNKMIDNETAINMQKEIIGDFLENSNDIFSSAIVKYNREITKIRKFDFDSDQVTVAFDTKIDVETKYLGAELEETTKKENFNANLETITLKKVDNNWKVVYADLTYYGGNQQGMMGTVTYNMM
ncbi:MAG: hypothetical protein HFJ54_05070 [Clostridia bacterium]|nr:hypothetical protein [Clostridia bacterium]